MMPDVNKNIVAVIPALNEQYAIGGVISLTQKYVSSIIVLNDGSTDDTANICTGHDIHLINNSKRMGKGNALRLLFKEAIKLDADIIITLDADGQHIPSQIPRLLKPLLLKESDMVVGSRFFKYSFTDISVIRNIGLRTINILQRILFNSQVRDTQSGFRAFSKRAFKVVLNSIENGYGIESEQLIIASNEGITVSEVPVDIIYNGLHKTSKKNFFKHGIELIIIIFKFYIRGLF